MSNRSYNGTAALVLRPFIWVHRSVVRAVLWLCREVYRWLSVSIMMLVVVVIEGAGHLLNIPHVEGWWAPLFGGGAVASGVVAWLHQWRKKPQRN